MIQQLAPLADQFQKTAPGMVILGVGLKMLGQLSLSCFL
jgi:hypothetical protein